MLILSRKAGQGLVIGPDVTVTVIEISSGRVRIGIEAPQDVRIRRGELAERLDTEGDGHAER